MGGSGSGDWQDGRPTTAGRVRLDIRAAVRAGLNLAAPADDVRPLSASWRGAGGILAALALEPIAGADGCADAVVVTSRGARLEVVGIVWTRTGYGRRPWWICPRCRGRAAILYSAGAWTLAPLACRTCHGLAYGSTRERGDVRADAALRRAAAALGIDVPAGGWASHTLDRLPTPTRPPGMRRATYRRRLERLERATTAAAAAWLAAFMGSGSTRRIMASLEADRARAHAAADSLDDSSDGADDVRAAFAAALAKPAR